MTIDWTVSLTTIINAGVGALVLYFGRLIRKAIREGLAFIELVNTYDDRIEDTATVVDDHSEILQQLGPTRFRKVSRQRRSSDIGA